VNMPDPGVGAAKCGVHTGIVEPIPVDLIEAKHDIERRGTSFLVLPAQIVEQLLCRQGELANASLQEVAGQRRFRCYHQLRRLRPTAHLSEKRSHPAEVLLVCPFLGADLGYGKAEHA
jgi:hypothetical protein